jgi:hypothetical protein
MITTWIENLILLAAGLLGGLVCEGLIAHQAVPVRAPIGTTQQPAGPPGRSRGVPVTALRVPKRALKR